VTRGAVDSPAPPPIPPDIEELDAEGVLRLAIDARC
jgi:hypothetical protein